MEDKKGSSSETAEMEASQVKFLKCFAMFLKEHREVLPTLPEMCERFTEIDWNMPTTVESPNFDIRRYTVCCMFIHVLVRVAALARAKHVHDRERGI